MTTVTNLLTGEPIDTEFLVWTNGDSNGFTPVDGPLFPETAQEFGYPDAGIYGDRQPWAWDENGGEDGSGCFWPVRLR